MPESSDVQLTDEMIGRYVPNVGPTPCDDWPTFFFAPPLVDTHVHLRRGWLLRYVLWLMRRFASYYHVLLPMPNTDPPIRNAADARQYEREIRRAGYRGRLIMTIKLGLDTTPEVIHEARRCGVLAAKLYPDGVTNNSKTGINGNNIGELFPVFTAMESCGMHLLIHPELPGPGVLEREANFLPIIERIHVAFPHLKITVEHITTRAAVETVLRLGSTVRATITLHHLCLTLDDVIGGNICPHHFCKPVAKYAEDRAAVRWAALSGNPKFRFGSDSAPHWVWRKESDCGCAGVFTATVALPLLVEVFAQFGQLEQLKAFCYSRGLDWFGLEDENPPLIHLIKNPVQPKVPRAYRFLGIFRLLVPFWSGKPLPYLVVKNSPASSNLP